MSAPMTPEQVRSEALAEAATLVREHPHPGDNPAEFYAGLLADAARPRVRRFTPLEEAVQGIETAIAPLTGDAKAGADMVLAYLRTLTTPDTTVPSAPIDPHHVTEEQARRIERDRPETDTAHTCNLPLSRRLDCGHCPHEVCQDCDRCPHTCRCGDTPAPRDLRPGAETARRMIADRQTAEDPHDSPLHRTYETSHDLPEVGGYRSAPLPAAAALCATCGHNGAAHHHAGTACWADIPKRLGEAIRLCKCSAFVEVTR